jgi:hypothetical protein
MVDRLFPFAVSICLWRRRARILPPAAHFSAHDAACAKLEPEKVIKQNIVTAASNLDTFSSLEPARTEAVPVRTI